MVRIEDENREIIQKMLIRFNIENFLFNKHVSIERRRKNTTNHANFMLIFTEKLIEDFMNVFFFLLLLIIKIRREITKNGPNNTTNSPINQPKTIIIIGF